MTRFVRLPSLLIAAVLVSGTAMAAPLSAQDNATAYRAGSLPLREARIFIRGGCPYNLDKVCNRHHGKLICHCQS